MVGIDTKSTAVLIIDPQNDFLSEGGAVWDLVGKGVRETKVVEHLIEIKLRRQKKLGYPSSILFTITPMMNTRTGLT